MAWAGGVDGLRTYSFTPRLRDCGSITEWSISIHDVRLVHVRLLFFLGFGGRCGSRGGRGDRGRGGCGSGLGRRVLHGELLRDAVELLLALVERLRLLLQGS